MLIKNLSRILKDYKFSLIPIVFYEIFYLLKGSKGNKFHFSNNNKMSDDIPCPYYFLTKIKKELREETFNTFIDLGCGSGRVIDFFSKSFSNKKFIGIENFNNQYKYCKKTFEGRDNIHILQEDFKIIGIGRTRLTQENYHDLIQKSIEDYFPKKKCANETGLKSKFIHLKAYLNNSYKDSLNMFIQKKYQQYTL